ILLRALVGGEGALRLAIEPEPGLLRGVPSCDLGSPADWPPCGVTSPTPQLPAPLLIQLPAGGRRRTGQRPRSRHFTPPSPRLALGPAMGLQPDQRHKNYKETQEQKKIRNSDAQHETVAPDHRSEVGAWPVAVVVLHLVAPRLPRIVEVTPLLDALSGTCPRRARNQPGEEHDDHPAEIAQGIQRPCEAVLPDVCVLMQEKGTARRVRQIAHDSALREGERRMARNVKALLVAMRLDSFVAGMCSEDEVEQVQQAAVGGPRHPPGDVQQEGWDPGGSPVIDEPDAGHESRERSDGGGDPQECAG